MTIRDEITEAYTYLQERTQYHPKLGIILGTGFDRLATLVEDVECYKYQDIPNFSITSVEGHEGTLLLGKIHGKEVVIMNGRCHYYEGYSPRKITIPVRVMKLLGVESIIITNCSGQANKDIEAGDLFVINNHLNFSGCNPLIGENLEEFGERFPDLAYPYDKEFITAIKDIANQENVRLKEGVYAMFSGPSYETAAETLMAATLGADIVGMSTVPEVIVANHCNMRVLAISGVPCLAAAYSDSEITHEQVMASCQSISDNAMIIIKKFIENM